MSTTLISIIFGAFAGALYHFSYMAQYKRLVAATQASSNSGQALIYPLLVGARMSVLGIVLYFLLLSGTIHLIIFVGAFFTTFWLLIFKKKAWEDGRITCL